MESGPFSSFVDYGERELEFRPLASITVPAQTTANPVDATHLSFIGGTFGRTDALQSGIAVAPPKEQLSPRHRWGVGYIAGVGPTELVDERCPVEITAMSSIARQDVGPAQREFRSAASLVLATLILVIVGVGWFVTTGSARAPEQTTIKTAPPVQHAPTTQPALPIVPDTQAQPVASPAAPVHHYTSVANNVPPHPAAPASAPVAHPPAAPVTQPPSAPVSGGTGHHGHGASNVWHHGGNAQYSDDEGH